MYKDYIVDIRITIKKHIEAYSPALARHDAIERAMRQFNVPRSHIKAEVLGLCDCGVLDAAD